MTAMRVQDPLSEAMAIQRDAAEDGFDWPHIAGVLDKLEEEVAELKEAVDAGDAGGALRELGDVLFSAVNVARFLPGEPGAELALANRRFSRRFESVKQLVKREGRAIGDCSLDELEAVWERAKGEEERTDGRGV